MHPLSIPYSISEEEILPFVKPITQSQIDQLKTTIKGRVYGRTETSFAPHARIFNGGIRSRACLVVLPADAHDISQIVVFCARHSLSPSIKSGGYGTHGYSVEGDVIIDMSNLTDIDMSSEYQPMVQESPITDAMPTDAPAPYNWPNSLLAVEEPPDILPSRRRKADDAFGDEADKTPSQTPPPPPALSLPTTERRVPKPRRVASGASGGPGDAKANTAQATSADVTMAESSISQVPPSSSPARESRRTRARSKSPEAFPSSFDNVLHGVREPAPSPPRPSPAPTRSSDTLFAPPTGGSAEGLLSPSISGSHSGSGSVSGPNDDEYGKGESPSTQITSADEEDGDKGNSQSAASESPAASSDVISDVYPSLSTSRPPLMVFPPSDANTITLASHARAGVSVRPGSQNRPPSDPPLSFDPSPTVSGPFGYPSPLPGSASSIATPAVSSSGPFDYAQPSALSTVTLSNTGSTSGTTRLPGPSQVRASFSEATESSNLNRTAYPIEPDHPFVYVTFGAGVTQRNVDAHTTANPYKGTSATGQVVDVPYYVPFAAHPVGSATMLLGGFGFMSRLHGLSLDALVEVEMVLADGRVIVVSEHQNSDLWWGIRGAGTAFGIATRYKAKAYPISVVFAGNIVYEFHKSTAASLVKHFRDCIKSAPRELYANLILTAGPRSNGALVVIQLCYIGTREQGAEFLQAILSWDGGTCLLNEVNEKTYWNQQDSVAKVLKAAAGRKWFIRSDLVTSLTDEVIHQSVARFADTPDGCAWLFELAGGAMVDYEHTCLPLTTRRASFNIVAFHQWRIEQVDEKCVDTAEEWLAEVITLHSPGGPLPSFFERKERVSRTIATYGDENWRKLILLKRKYDPTGFIRHCFWPLDEDGRPLGLDEEMAEVHVKDDAPDDAPDSSRPDAVSKATADSSAGVHAKGKAKEDMRTGNHFMDRLLQP